MLEEKTITLTPIKIIFRLPISGNLLGAVQMGPQGLQFATPATLKFEFSVLPTTQNRLVGFFIKDDGTDFTLAPITQVGNTVTLQVSHFSGAGVFELNEEDLVTFLLDLYYLPGGIMHSLKTVNSCVDQFFEDSVSKMMQFWRFVELFGLENRSFEPRPCRYPPDGISCSNFGELRKAVAESLENVISIVFLEEDKQCSVGNPLKERDAVVCLGRAAKFGQLGIIPTENLEETLWPLKTCGIYSIEITPQKAHLAINGSTELKVTAKDRSGSILSR